MTIAAIAGLFNSTAGLMLVAGVGLFIGGYIEYLSHLGTEVRVKGLKKMEWGVMILFVLILMLFVVGLLQRFFV